MSRILLQNELFLDMLTSFKYGVENMPQRNYQLLDSWVNFIAWSYVTINFNLTAGETHRDTSAYLTFRAKGTKI